MKLKLSIEVFPEGGGKSLSTGVFQADSRSLREEPSMLDLPPDCGETANTAVGHVRSLPAEWTRDFIRSI